MSELVALAATLALPDDRAMAAAALGRLLGGDDVVVFVRDAEVGVLLPAPGFPQTLSDARVWRRFLEACAEDGMACAPALSLPGRAAAPAYGVASGRDVVAVVLGADQPSPHVRELRELLPLLASTSRGERAAAHAAAQAQLARQTAEHAQSLATALDAMRAHLQRALADATHAREAAEVANRSKTEFLSAMSHELRTPLNAIGGYTELLALGLRGPLTDEQRQDLGRIRRANQHLMSLITDILNFARIEAGQLEYHVADVDVASLVADVEAMIGPQFGERELTFTHDTCVDAPPGCALVVHADREKVRQILINLLSNAIKFTAVGGHVTLWSDADPARRTVRLHVRDTGRGIPAGQLERIFEPFVQIDRQYTQASQQGVGLGLAISRDLARGMGGDLAADSVLGVGSTFTLTLPCAKDPGAVTSA